MAPRVSVCPLEDLCLQVVVITIKTIVDSHCQRPKLKDSRMQEDLKTIVEYIPIELHDKLADMLLHAVVEIFGEEGYSEDIAASDNSRLKTWFKGLMSMCISSDDENEFTADHGSDFFQSQTYFDRLMSVIDHLQIKKLVLENRPAYIERKFSDLFDNMANLEVFSCKDSWISVGRPGFNFGKLLTGYPALANLTSFTMRYYCTDKILSVICENCKALREVDVGRYKSWPCRITDLSVESLIKCRKLEHVNLHNTTVSSDGFLKLLCETRSRRLCKIDGLEMCLDKVLDEMAAFTVPKFSKMGQETGSGIEFDTVSLTFRAFPLQELRCHNLNEDHLNLTVKYFPHLTDVFFNFWGSALPRDFSVLSKLKNLKKVGFEFLDCSPADVSEILSTCPRVASISIRQVNICTISAWLHNLSSLCPDVERLVVGGTDESSRLKKGESAHFTSCPETLAPNAFQNLTELVWYEPTLMNAKLVLRQATNVQTVHFYRATDLSDDFFESVFQHNPLSRLKKLTINYTSNKCCKLSCDVMKRIIADCEQLTDFSILLFFHPVIEDFTSSTRRLVKKKESFQQVRDFIVENNYGVNFEVRVMNRPLAAYHLM